MKENNGKRICGGPKNNYIFVVNEILKNRIDERKYLKYKNGESKP
jgi:hypothetical protein